MTRAQRSAHAVGWWLMLLLLVAMGAVAFRSASSWHSAEAIREAP